MLGVDHKLLRFARSTDYGCHGKELVRHALVARVTTSTPASLSFSASFSPSERNGSIPAVITMVDGRAARSALTKSTAPASAINNSYPPFLLKGLWIKFGVAAQDADSKHIFPYESLRGNTGSISTLTQDGASTFHQAGGFDARARPCPAAKRIALKAPANPNSNPTLAPSENPRASPR
jgi:hypothetical protein